MTGAGRGWAGEQKAALAAVSTEKTLIGTETVNPSGGAVIRAAAAPVQPTKSRPRAAPATTSSERAPCPKMTQPSDTGKVGMRLKQKKAQRSGAAAAEAEREAKAQWTEHRPGFPSPASAVRTTLPPRVQVDEKQMNIHHSVPEGRNAR
eukprot:CAMPEP_0196769700 /NCGR_PEP_ID=MMETSP1104-20130614/701_1 /TAXON_ID=33652 /ORGANISM="Cafeteria sp., Strain Caron Lab Isolate" /LENGTH=148 /DNA_ID=CAMNT_0042139799 /DNA_START=380 /DNA_END=826 /DNA_ORIENTATION=-